MNALKIYQAPSGKSMKGCLRACGNGGAIGCDPLRGFMDSGCYAFEDSILKPAKDGAPCFA